MSIPYRLTPIMTDRAGVIPQLATADSQRCAHDCPALRVRRVALASKLGALNAKADEIQ